MDASSGTPATSATKFSEPEIGETRTRPSHLGLRLVPPTRADPHRNSANPKLAKPEPAPATSVCAWFHQPELTRTEIPSAMPATALIGLAYRGLPPHAALGQSSEDLVLGDAGHCADRPCVPRLAAPCCVGPVVRRPGPRRTRFARLRRARDRHGVRCVPTRFARLRRARDRHGVRCVPTRFARLRRARDRHGVRCVPTRFARLQLHMIYEDTASKNKMRCKSFSRVHGRARVSSST